MKCVCPMGGDRTCPDDCLIAKWHNLPADDRRAQRKTYAEQLYKQKYTMEQIANQLGVAKSTISEDLRNCSTVEQSKPVKTATNPKGAGRSKGSKARRKYEAPEVKEVARDIVDGTKTYPEAEKETGLSNTVIRAAVKQEEGRREAQAEPTITADMLSMTAQQKLETAIKQYKEKLNREFHDRVQARVQDFLMNTTLPKHKQEQAEARRIQESRRRGIMTKTTFNAIRRALHPDSRLSISDDVLARAFDEFMSLEKLLLNKEDSPSDLQKLPETWAEWEAMRHRPKAKTPKPGSMVRH